MGACAYCEVQSADYKSRGGRPLTQENYCSRLFALSEEVPSEVVQSEVLQSEVVQSLLLGGVRLARGEDLIDEAILHGLLGGEDLVTLDISTDLFNAS